MARQLSPARDGRDRVTVTLGAVLTMAVFVDGWAHFNRPGMETFFTPWHGALYSALALLTGWVALLGFRRWSDDKRSMNVIPKGYGPMVAGLAVFSAGGLADMVWHNAFGTEVAVDALLSPTHLILGVGGILIVSTPMRTALGKSASGEPRWTGPAVVSLVLATALAAFFLLYVSAFAGAGPTVSFVPTREGAPGHEDAELPVIASLGGYLVSTVLLTVPLVLLLAHRARTPRGAITLLVGVIAFLTAAVVGFPQAQLAGATGATLAVAGTDVAITAPPVLRWLATSHQARPLVLAGIISAVWGGQFAGLAVTEGLRWPVSLWLGVVVLSAVLAAALAALTGSAPQRPGATATT